MNFLIYKHTSPAGKSYIGQTCNIQKRNSAHQKESNGCVAFYAAIQKYGWESFLHEIIEDGLTAQQANEKEVFYISKFNTISPYGYNLRYGGACPRLSEESKQKIAKAHTGKVLSEETKAKVSKSLIGNQRAKGFKHSDETRRKVSEGNRNRKNTKKRVITPEGRAKLSAARQNVSDETRKKMSDSHKKRAPVTQETKDKLSALLKDRWVKLKSSGDCGKLTSGMNKPMQISSDLLKRV